MFTDGNIFLIRCLTPMHAGVGQDIGSIDMPIQREGNTNLPKVEASTFKGSLRAQIDSDKADKIFGKENTNDTSGAGALGITDLKLLFYPIKTTDNDIYKLVTCPFLLNRFVEDVNILKSINVASVSVDISENFIKEDIESGKCISSRKTDGAVDLDGYEFKVENKKEEISLILNKIILLENKQQNKEIVVISNEDFMELEELNREIVTRNKIDQNTGTVENGMLFVEEYLSAESIMYGLLLFSPFTTYDGLEGIITEIFGQKTNEKIPSKYFQIGGNSNLGKGIVEMKIIKE